jgi:hypothetical protein
VPAPPLSVLLSVLPVPFPKSSIISSQLANKVAKTAIKAKNLLVFISFVLTVKQSSACKGKKLSKTDKIFFFLFHESRGFTRIFSFFAYKIHCQVKKIRVDT